jgi:hypothetical protein
VYDNPTKSLFYSIHTHLELFGTPFNQIFAPPTALLAMLRRPATTIQLTAADVEQYEASRQRKLWEQQQAQVQASSQSTDASEKTKEQVTPAVPQKSKKDRIMGGGRAN